MIQIISNQYGLWFVLGDKRDVSVDGAGDNVRSTSY